MSQTTKARRRVKPARSIRWVMEPSEQHPFGVLKIRVGAEVDVYFFRRLPCTFEGCEAFEVQKLAQEGACTAYHILLDGQSDKHSCECEGFLRHGHCKHVEGLLVLLRKRSAGTTPVGPINAPGGAEK
jgi:hypothetical protein